MLDVFHAFLPFEPVGDVADLEKADAEWLIRGIVSSELEDADGDIIVQKGIDWSYFLKSGFLTREHPAMPENIIGEPLSVDPVEIDGIAASVLVARLFKDRPLAKGIWESSVGLKKSGSSRKLGLSIEGHVIGQRDGKRVPTSRVTTVAATAVPKNSITFFDPIMASVIAASQTPAGHMGYPVHGVAYSGGVDATAAQSMSRGKDSATYGSKAIKGYLDGVSVEDLQVMHLLRGAPHLNWHQGVAAIAALRPGVAA